MLIVGNEILKRQLLLDADEEHISNATYYLTINKIISGGEEEEKDSITIRPGEIVWVVSHERFNIGKRNCIAHVSLKSGLTKQGLLALDTGFVDPRFEGPIGTILVNFSKNNVSISRGEEFSRVIFLEHGQIDEKYLGRDMPKYKSVEEYANVRKKEIARDYESKFLNTDAIVEAVQAKVLDSAKSELIDKLLLHFLRKYLIWIVLALVILGITIFGLFSIRPLWLHKEEILNLIMKSA